MHNEKLVWKPGNMLYPLPAVLVSCTDGKGHDNLITVAWTGTVCSDPPMLYISVRKERYSHALLMQTREFAVNLTTKDLCFATDYCGVKSGRDVDKWAQMHLTKQPAQVIQAPLLAESPVNIECRVKDVLPLGSHDMFLADVVSVSVDEAYMKDGKFDLSKAQPLIYSHGEYFEAGAKLGKFGYSVKKTKENG